MSLTESVYLRLPIPLKQAALSYYGRKLEQLRYATAEQDEREWGIGVLAGKSWPELRELQNQRLAALVHRARKYSPFWTERLLGLTVESEADLQQLPALSKQELRRAGRSVVCTDISPRDLVQEQTS